MFVLEALILLQSVIVVLALISTNCPELDLRLAISTVATVILVLFLLIGDTI